MKVVFTPIDDLLPMGLTIGKIYEVVEKMGTDSGNEKSSTKGYYQIQNDKVITKYKMIKVNNIVIG